MSGGYSQVTARVPLQMVSGREGPECAGGTVDGAAMVPG
jgi:hypothetical protein